MMHPRVSQEFERICSERKAGGTVLEIGAVPSEDTLLCLESLKNAHKKIGINLDGPYTYKDFEILKVNANDMSCFADSLFDTVVTNATLEHDGFFWKTLSEIKRVTRSGGLIAIGVPGFTKLEIEKSHRLIEKIPLLGRLLSRHLDFLFASTLVLQIHNYPGDYYRFSPQAMREVFFSDMKEVKVRSFMIPPRIIGCGIKG
jgi:SAM-dependent methyltransferase